MMVWYEMCLVLNIQEKYSKEQFKRQAMQTWAKRERSYANLPSTSDAQSASSAEGTEI